MPPPKQQSSTDSFSAQDPNKKDADVHVESAPIRPPTGPLGGLKSSSSSSQASRRNTSSPAESQQNAARVKLKYQPKSGIARKTKEERDSLNAKFQPAENSESSGRSTSGSRGHRGHRGRGRGSGQSDRGRRNDEPLFASGPFSSGNASNFPGGGGGGGSSGARLSRIGPSGGMGSANSMRRSRSSKITVIKGEDGRDEYTMEDLSASSDGEHKVDVERIDLVGGSEDEEADKKKESSALPVRITRHEHVDRVKLSNLNIGDAEQKPSGFEKGKFKQEVPDPPDSKVSVKIAIEHSQDGSAGDESKKYETKSRKPLIQTLEDMDELERLKEERAAMLRELGPSTNDMDIESRPPQNHGLYLFQFPPVMPKLISLNSGDVGRASKESSKIKDEHNVDLSTEDSGATEFPPGLAGKLRVHKSGRVTLLWGGISFEVHKGVDCEFLQEFVAVEKAIYSNDPSVKPRATSLGQLKGKYVISPDFDKLLAE